MATKKALREASDAIAEKTIAEIVKHFPALAHSGAKRPGVVARHLQGLLNAICWRKGAITKLGIEESFKAYKVFLEEVSKDWTPERHDEVVEYLEAGCPDGFPPPAMLEERKKKRSFKKAATEAATELSSMLVDEMTDEKLLEELTKDLKPAGQMSPEHELEEIVLEAERAMNPNYKTW